MQRSALITTLSVTHQSAAIDANEFDRLMEPFISSGQDKGFAVAVSGGPDSMALALCMKRWASTRQTDFMALIVDHQLRPESHDEALTTQARLSAINIKSEILQWHHDAVTSRIHSEARQARYQLLADACRQHKTLNLLMAHQREDQAETVLMRIAKGSGLDGLAGIPRQNHIGDLRILRPFLDVAKERLIATCETAHMKFVEDPSNKSEKYARGRLRRVLPLLADEGMSIERLVDLAERATETKEAIDHYTLQFLQTATHRTAADVIHIDPNQLRNVPRAIAHRAVAICLKNFQAGDYMPERVSLAALVESLCTTEESPVRTLYGCMISRQPERITIMREFSALPKPMEMLLGQSILWDGRWQVELLSNVPHNKYLLGPLGSPTHEVVDKLAPGLRHNVSQGRARSSLPALWLNDELVFIPVFNGVAAYPSPVRASLASAWPTAPQAF